MLKAIGFVLAMLAGLYLARAMRSVENLRKEASEPYRTEDKELAKIRFLLTTIFTFAAVAALALAG